MNVLQTLRSLFLAFCGAIASIGIVAVILTGGEDFGGSMSVGVAGAAVAAWGLVSLFLRDVAAPALDCSSDGALLGSFRTRFFLRLAIAETPALVGFVAVVLTGSPVPYLLGAAFTAIGFWRLAPSDRNLAAEQERLSLSGCGRSLPGLLAEASTAPRGDRR